MERDRYMSPMEAQEFGILDKVLVHPPQDGEDEPELVQKEPGEPTAPGPGCRGNRLPPFRGLWA